MDDAARARGDLGRELHVHQDRAARPRRRRWSPGPDRAGGARARAVRRGPGPAAAARSSPWTARPARRRPDRRPVPADRRGRGGDLLLARRDPRRLDAALHRAARDPRRPGGALPGRCACGASWPASSASPSCSGSTSAARPRRCSAGSRSSSPASATRSAAFIVKHRFAGVQPIGVAAGVMVVEHGPAAAVCAGDDPRPTPQASDPSRRWSRSASSAPGSRSRSSTT